MDMERLLLYDSKRSFTLFEDALTPSSNLLQFIKLCCSVLNESSSIVDKVTIKESKPIPIINTLIRESKETAQISTGTGTFVSKEPVNIFATKPASKGNANTLNMNDIILNVKKHTSSLLNSSLVSSLFKKTNTSPIDNVHIQLDLVVLKCKPFQSIKLYKGIAILVEKSILQDKYGVVNAEFQTLQDSLIKYLNFSCMYRFNNLENPTGTNSEILRRGYLEIKFYFTFRMCRLLVSSC